MTPKEALEGLYGWVETFESIEECKVQAGQAREFLDVLKEALVADEWKIPEVCRPPSDIGEALDGLAEAEQTLYETAEWAQETIDAAHEKHARHLTTVREWVGAAIPADKAQATFKELGEATREYQRQADAQITTLQSYLKGAREENDRLRVESTAGPPITKVEVGPCGITTAVGQRDRYVQDLNAEITTLREENKRLQRQEQRVAGLEHRLNRKGMEASEMKNDLRVALEERDRLLEAHVQKFNLKAQITTIREERDRLRGTLEALKSESDCPECGETYEVKVIGCQFCGWGIREETHGELSGESPDTPKCKFCGDLPYVQCDRCPPSDTCGTCGGSERVKMWPHEERGIPEPSKPCPDCTGKKGGGK